MSADFFQLAYVTNDFERAISELRSLHGLGRFKEMPDTHMPTGPGREAIAHFGLAFKGDVQFEVIAPTGGDSDIYREPLPAAAYALRYHHLGRYLSASEEYERLLAAHSARWAMPIHCSGFGGFYAYADARKDLGHYLESSRSRRISSTTYRATERWASAIGADGRATLRRSSDICRRADLARKRRRTCTRMSRCEHPASQAIAPSRRPRN
jgi:hypothetical protein